MIVKKVYEGTIPENFLIFQFFFTDKVVKESKLNFPKRLKIILKN